jgi:hypothetical protein
LAYQRHCERSEAIHSFFAVSRWIASSQALLAMTVRGRCSDRARFNFKQQMSVRILAARFARALHFVVPRKREQGMPGARCTRGLACKTGNKKAHEHTGQRRQSDIPCAMALRLIPRSSRRANSSCHRRCRLDSGSNPVGSISPPTAWHQQGVSEPRGFTVRNNAVRLRAVRSLTGLAQSRTRPAIHLRA